MEGGRERRREGVYAYDIKLAVAPKRSLPVTSSPGAQPPPPAPLPRRPPWGAPPSRRRAHGREGRPCARGLLRAPGPGLLCCVARELR